MNPMAEEAIAAIFRSLFMVLAGFLVEHGVWTAADAKIYVAGAALFVVGLGWSLWSKYKSRIKFLTALTMQPGATEADVNKMVASDSANPSVATPKDTPPQAGV